MFRFSLVAAVLAASVTTAGEPQSVLVPKVQGQGQVLPVAQTLATHRTTVSVPVSGNVQVPIEITPQITAQAKLGAVQVQQAVQRVQQVPTSYGCVNCNQPAVSVRAPGVSVQAAAPQVVPYAIQQQQPGYVLTTATSGGGFVPYEQPVVVDRGIGGRMDVLLGNVGGRVLIQRSGILGRRRLIIE